MKKTSVSKSLGIEAPWKILEDAYDDTAKQRTVTCTDTSSLECPKCGKASPFYDLRVNGGIWIPVLSNGVESAGSPGQV